MNLIVPKFRIGLISGVVVLAFMISIINIFATQKVIEYDERFLNKPGTYKSDKNWTIKFNSELDEKYVNSIYVTKDSEGEQKINDVIVEVSKNNEIIVKAPNKGYDSGEYYLFIDENISSRDKKYNNLNKRVKMKFKIEKNIILSKQNDKDVIKVPGIKDEMLSSDFWTSNLEEKSKIILDDKGVQEFNKQNIDRVKSVHDLFSFDNKFKSENIHQWIREYKIPSRTMYDKDNNIINQNTYNKIIENMNLKNDKEFVETKYGIVVSRTDLRRYPSNLQGYYKKNDVFDRFQETAVDAGEMVLILHESDDGKWLFVQSYNYRGWIRSEDIAIGDKSDIKEFMEYKNFIIVLEDCISLQTDKREYNYFMGTKLPIIDESNNIVVKIPTRKKDGSLEFHKAIIDENAEINKGYLKYTNENFIKQAFKLLGTKYEWGDKGAGRDCSSTLMSIYKTLGIYLPRNTDQQEAGVGKHISLKGFSTNQRYEVLDTIKPGAALFMNGHVVMYLGEYENKHYIIHNFSGIRVEQKGESKYIPILRVAVTPVDMKSSSGKSFINLYTSILEFK